jgi:tetratricopeptide (TPR) repeat protein
MTRTRLVAFTLLVGLGPLLLHVPLDAHESNGTPAARALFSKGEAATKAGKHAEAAAAFRKAIEADPDFVEAHQRFIESTRRERMPTSRTPTLPHLQALYERWAKRYPKRAAYRWALGFLSHEPAKADVFFNEALTIDPAFARAHFLLARNADLRGDWISQRRHLKAAVESNPENPQYLLRYAHAHKSSEPKRFQELALSVVQKFRDSPTAAEALYHLANESSNPERRAYFEQLRENYPADRFSYASLAMSVFYDELTTSSEALSLAKDMVKWLPASKTWAQRVAHQEAMARAETLIAQGEFSEALRVIQKTQRPSGSHATTWGLVKAEAGVGAGQLDQVYTTLLESVAATPDNRMQAALVKYGTALKKSPQEIDTDLWRIRDAKATPATPFKLAGARDGKPVQLSDYRGRVVLLAFWFPG